MAFPSRARLTTLLAGLLAACAPPAPAATTAAPEPSATAAPAAPSAAPADSALAVASAAPPPASASAAVAPPAAPRGPFNVLMISIDSLRADMPWAGYPRDIAPNLTALQKRAITYTSGYSVSSFTSKSIGGLLGGRYPSELKRTGSFFTRYLDENAMFPEALAAQKVHTIGGHAHAFFGKGQSGFEQGFEAWRLVPEIPFDYNTDPYITSQKLTPLAQEMLGDSKLTSGRFFAWFHYMDPHERYQPHAESPKFGKKQRDIYDEEVFYTDLYIGKLLAWVDQQPWAKETVIVVTADHGEAFGEHKIYRHAFELYEVLVHVPLFFIVPGQAPRAIAAPRSHIDVVPTLFDLMGVKPNPELRGKSFAPELFGAEAEPRDVVCDLPEDSHNERRRSLLHDGYKIIAFANDFRYELYNLKNDPNELDELSKKEPDKLKQLIALYKKTSEGIIEAPVKGGIEKHKPK
jgi:arylsulfatase A-like enzyme